MYDMFDYFACGVYKLLKNQKPHKATGPDEVPAFILRSAAQQLAPILTQIYRHSLDIGAVPQDRRDAWVVPIFKKTDLNCSLRILALLWL
jgi:hypothetical protein